MSKERILDDLKQAMVDLDEDSIHKLLNDALQASLSPMDIIMDGLSPGLTVIGEGFETGERFMADLVIAGEIMNDAMPILRPAIEAGAGGQSISDTMVIGTVEGDDHNIGKRIVSAMFSGAGYRVVDIGENMPASGFVKAVVQHKPIVIGASAILGPLKPYCKVINDALIDAGLRDGVIYIIGGWGMTQEWCDDVGADAFGENAIDAVRKVKLIRTGELPKIKERIKK
jgi:methanogenic corrinoid protein MtbC1